MANQSIHDTTNINGEQTGKRLIGNIEIGKYCALARGTLLQGTDHAYTQPAVQGMFYRKHFEDETLPRKREKITLKNDVWVCANATILKGVTIGNGAIIAADAVVTKDVEPYEIVGGNPAKHIGWRFEDKELRQFLNQLKWWNWENEKIRDNKEFFTADLNQLTLQEIKELIK